MGCRRGAARSPDHPASGPTRVISTDSAPRAGPPGPSPGGAGPRSALVRRRICRLGRRRVGPFRGPGAEPCRACGAAPGSPRARRCASGSATTADAAYALAASAVIELARRNPSGSLDAPHVAADRGRGFRGRRSRHYRLTMAQFERSGARPCGGGTAWSPGCWPGEGGASWRFVCGCSSGFGGEPTCPAARRSTKGGRSTPNPTGAPELDPTAEP